MRPSALLFFLAGLGIGLAVGFLLRDSPEPGRTSRRPAADPTPPTDRVKNAAGKQRGDTTAPVEAKGEGRRERTIDAPRKPAGEGLGVLIVDCRGSQVQARDVEVYGLSMLGEPTQASMTSAEDGLARFDLWPGSYRAEWHEDVRGRRVVAARVKAAQTTTLRVTDPRIPGEDPVPEGLGRLHVSLFEMDGRPMPLATVLIYGPGVNGIEENEIDTETDGTGYENVRPGPYRVVIGSQARRVEVLAGETARVVLRYVDEGEVEIRSTLPGWPILKRQGEEAPYPPFGSWLQEEGLSRLVFVQPGAYEVYLNGTYESGARFIGHVRVTPGRRSLVVATLPPGAILLSVEGEGEPPARPSAILKATRLEAGTNPRFINTHVQYKYVDKRSQYPGKAQFHHVPAGRWRLEYRPKGYQPVAAEVSVGTETVELTIRLRRAN